MSTEFVSPLDLSEEKLDQQKQHYDLSEQLIRNCDIQMRKTKTVPASQNNEEDRKLPRRKDTPALNKPPFIPDFSELLLKRFDEVEKQQKNTQIPSAMNNDLRKPKRKDSPALHTSLLLPGVKSIKTETRTINVENEENDG